MPPRELHIIGVDPGGTTGWCRLTVPRASVVAGAPGEIIEWDYGELTGRESDQVKELCSIARVTQGLAYKVGPAMVVEAWDNDPSFKSTDTEPLSPVRIGAMLVFCLDQTKLLNDARIHFQGRTMAFSTATDERLKRWGLYIAGSDHIRAATRHAITALRRAKANPALASELWYLD